MVEKATNMFTKLNNVINFHGESGLIQLGNVSSNVSAVTVSTEPGWHETGFAQNGIRSYRGYEIEDDTVTPLDERITTFGSGFGSCVTLFAEVVKIAF